jgi:hypothetical protein
VFEETGLRVIGFRPEVRTKLHSQKGDDTDPVPAPDEVREITWMRTSDLRKLIAESPERIFTFQLPVLELYLSQHPDAQGHLAPNRDRESEGGPGVESR